MNWSLLALISLTVALSQVALDLGVFTPKPAAAQTGQEAQSNGNSLVTDIRSYIYQKYGV
jgi:hypothetical protein